MSVNAFVPSLKEFFKYYGTFEKPLADFPYNFEFIMKLKAPLNAKKVLKILMEWFQHIPNGASSSWMVGSHGFSRVSTRFGSDSVDALNMMCLLLPGTAVSISNLILQMSFKELVLHFFSTTRYTLIKYYIKGHLLRRGNWYAGHLL